jgi:hypothetical protein
MTIDSVENGSLADGFLRRVELTDGPGFEPARYPFSLPVARALLRRPLDLDPGVTFLAGDNGTGKSTLEVARIGDWRAALELDVCWIDRSLSARRLSRSHRRRPGHQP